MRIISRKTLREFWEKYSRAKIPLQAWYADAKQAYWNELTLNMIRNLHDHLHIPAELLIKKSSSHHRF